MQFGLTLKELLEVTQSDQPDALKRGEVARVLEILQEHYEDKQLSNLQMLQSLEQKRTLRLEAESGVFLDQRSKPKALRQKQPKFPNKQHRNKHQHKEQQPQNQQPEPELTDQNNDETSTESKNWMDTQKPGVHPSPGLDQLKCQDESKQKTDDASSSTSDDEHLTSESTDGLENPDACLHLPLWMVRHVTPLIREFLEAQHYSPLFNLGNALVVTTTKR